MREELKQFVKDLVDEYPVGDENALKIFNFYKKWTDKI